MSFETVIFYAKLDDLAAAQLKNLYANAGNIPAFATPAVQALLQQQQQLAAAHAAASQANPTVTEQTAEMLRHHGLAHLAAAQPLSASVTPTPGSGHQGQQNSQSNSQSPKNPRIPVDPAPPRKSSAAPMHSQSLQVRVGTTGWTACRWSKLSRPLSGSQWASPR